MGHARWSSDGSSSACAASCTSRSGLRAIRLCAFSRSTRWQAQRVSPRSPASGSGWASYAPESVRASTSPPQPCCSLLFSVPRRYARWDAWTANAKVREGTSERVRLFVYGPGHGHASHDSSHTAARYQAGASWRRLQYRDREGAVPLGVATSRQRRSMSEHARINAHRVPADLAHVWHMVARRYARIAPSTPLHPWHARTSIEAALGGRGAIADAIPSTASRLTLESHRGASCPRGVRISWLELACGERENQSRTLGCHRRLPSGGRGALYQVLDNSPSRPGRCSASTHPALVKARQYCLPHA